MKLFSDRFTCVIRSELYLRQFREERYPMEQYREEHPRVASIRDLFRSLF